MLHKQPTQNTKQSHMPTKKEGGRRPPSKNTRQPPNHSTFNKNKTCPNCQTRNQHRAQSKTTFLLGKKVAEGYLPKYKTCPQLHNFPTVTHKISLSVYVYIYIYDLRTTRYNWYMDTPVFYIWIHQETERETERERYRIRQGSTYLVQGVCVARGVFWNARQKSWKKRLQRWLLQHTRCMCC